MNSSVQSGFVNHVMLYALLGVGFTGSVGIGTVWGQHQISVEARRDEDLERQIESATRRTEELTAEIAREQDPNVLQNRNAQWQLGLVPPSESQLQPVSVDPVDRLMAKNNREAFRVPGLAGFKTD